MNQNENMDVELTLTEENESTTAMYDLSPEDFNALAANATVLDLDVGHPIEADTCVCCPERAEHWFQLQVVKNAKYSFSADVCVGARLYDAYGNLLASDNDDGEKNSFLIDYELDEWTGYYLRVMPKLNHFMRFNTVISNTAIAVESISMSPNAVTLIPDETVTLSASVVPHNATWWRLTWSSSNDNVAQVGFDNGVVTAVSPGTATIYAKPLIGGEEEAICTVTVKDPTVTGTTVRVKCSSGLSLMSAPAGGTVLGTFDNGANITLLDETPQNEIWYKVWGVMSNGSEAVGWCSGEYLEKTVTFLKYIQKETTSYVRKGTSRQANIVGEISCGMQVELVPEEMSSNDGFKWYKVIYNDEIAYVAHFAGRFNEVERSVPLRCAWSPIADDRYLEEHEMEYNAKIVYNYLTYMGWTKNAICGVIANMEAESKLSSGIWERQKENDNSQPAYGVLQWDPFTKWTNYADKYNYAYSDLYRQLAYFIYSTRHGGGEWIVKEVAPTYQLYAYEYIYSTQSAYYLASVFMLCYVRPKDSGASVMEERGNLAEKWKRYFDSIGW